MSSPKFKVGDVVRVTRRSTGLMDDWGEDYEGAVRGDNLHTITEVDFIGGYGGKDLYCYHLRHHNWFLGDQLILASREGVVSVTSLDYTSNDKLDDEDKSVIKSYIEELENGG